MEQCSETVGWHILATMVGYNINVGFKEFGQVYYHAYIYFTKIHSLFKTSPGHPFLGNPPRAGLSEVYMLSNEMLSIISKIWSPPPKKKPRLHVEVLNDIAIKNKIRTNDELLLFSKKQSIEGKRDIWWWLLTHTHLFI